MVKKIDVDRRWTT